MNATQNGPCYYRVKYIPIITPNPTNTPLETNFIISSGEFDKGDEFLNNKIKTDISYAIQVLSQFMNNPGNSHLKVAFSSPGKGVALSKSNIFELKEFFDADWAKSLATRKSVTGYMVYFTIIKKHSTVSRSSTESEYRALGSICVR
uniref:Uncharacterized protein n=1 Tax=Lactuca sativa TaxID=4236 RepID=A0A9R1W9S7_LACSA|nr:hypothetical protein LSAT_V11C300150940 [Lactuca sativa]